MLPPEDFGSYFAVGTQKRTMGQAMFFSIEGLDKSDVFDLKAAARDCVPHPDGEPKHSVYISVYRVLEQIPFAAIRNLHLVTPDGRVLTLEPGKPPSKFERKYHLYQEICPVHPRIVSDKNPVEFIKHITSPRLPIHLPRVCFVDLRLGELAEDPEHAAIHDLPYHAIEHLRDCLIQLKRDPEKGTKTVDRIHPQSFPYRTVETGVYVGDAKEMRFYPFPPVEELKSRHYDWWRSASIMGDILGST